MTLTHIISEHADNVATLAGDEGPDLYISHSTLGGQAWVQG